MPAEANQVASFVEKKKSIWEYKQNDSVYVLIVVLWPIWHHPTLSVSDISDCVFNEGVDAHIL